MKKTTNVETIDYSEYAIYGPSLNKFIGQTFIEDGSGNVQVKVDWTDEYYAFGENSISHILEMMVHIELLGDVVAEMIVVPVVNGEPDYSEAVRAVKWES